MIRLPFNLTGPATLYRVSGPNSYEISNNNSVIGTATSLDLPTGGDTLGSLLRIPRVPNEDDASYLGRLQRLLMVSTLRQYSGSTRLITRQLSAYLGRVSITQSWDGVTSSALDTDTSFLDPLIISEPVTIPNEEIVINGLNGASSADLSGVHLIRSAGKLLLLGQDYLITGAGTFTFTKTPILPLAIYSTQNKAYATFPQQESTSVIGFRSLPSAYKRFSTAPAKYTPIATSFFLPPSGLVGIGNSGNFGPFLRGRGVSVNTLNQIAATLLSLPGGSSLTPLGFSTITETPLYWSNSMSTGKGYQVGLDL